MSQSIQLSDKVFNLLDEEARRRHLSPGELADRLLAEQLSAEREAWRAELAELLARMHERTAGHDPAQIEADITAAYEDVKAERRAGRRSA